VLQKHSTNYENRFDRGQYNDKIAQMEPTTKYKHLAVASGATPIGNAVRVPDEVEIFDNIARYQYISSYDVTLHIYSHREHQDIKSLFDSTKYAT
jgi:hypothetical protein